jgi:hypothetical protein
VKTLEETLRHRDAAAQSRPNAYHCEVLPLHLCICLVNLSVPLLRARSSR